MILRPSQDPLVLFDKRFSMKYFIAYISLLTGGFIFAQHDIQQSQALSNLPFFNPAANGLTREGSVSLGNRTQWIGVDGRPSTSYLAFQTKLKTGNETAALDEFTPDRKRFFESAERAIEKKHSIGGRLYSDQIGPFKRTSIQGSYAYHLPITKTISISAGLALGISGFSIDESKIALQSAGDNTYLNYVSLGNRQRFLDAAAGIMAYHKKWVLGISTSQAMNNTTQFQQIPTMSAYSRHYYAVGSYQFSAGKELMLEPYTLGKWAKGTPFTTDLGLRTHYKKMGFLSLGYRFKSAVALGVGLNAFKQFQVVYNYDFNVGATRNFLGNTHEIQLNYVFGHKRNLDREFDKEKREQEQRERQNEEDN